MERSLSATSDQLERTLLLLDHRIRTLEVHSDSVARDKTYHVDQLGFLPSGSFKKETPFNCDQEKPSTARSSESSRPASKYVADTSAETEELFSQCQQLRDQAATAQNEQSASEAFLEALVDENSRWLLSNPAVSEPMKAQVRAMLLHTKQLQHQAQMICVEQASCVETSEPASNTEYSLQYRASPQNWVGNEFDTFTQSTSNPPPVGLRLAQRDWVPTGLATQGAIDARLLAAALRRSEQLEARRSTAVKSSARRSPVPVPSMTKARIEDKLLVAAIRRTIHLENRQFTAALLADRNRFRPTYPSTSSRAAANCTAAESMNSDWISSTQTLVGIPVTAATSISYTTLEKLRREVGSKLSNQAQSCRLLQSRVAQLLAQLVSTEIPPFSMSEDIAEPTAAAARHDVHSQTPAMFDLSKRDRQSMFPIQTLTEQHLGGADAVYSSFATIEQHTPAEQPECDFAKTNVALFNKLMKPVQEILDAVCSDRQRLEAEYAQQAADESPSGRPIAPGSTEHCNGWRSVLDQKTGRYYYYSTKDPTHSTCWHMTPKSVEQATTESHPTVSGKSTLLVNLRRNYEAIRHREVGVQERNCDNSGDCFDSEQLQQHTILQGQQAAASKPAASKAATEALHQEQKDLQDTPQKHREAPDQTQKLKMVENTEVFSLDDSTESQQVSVKIDDTPDCRYQKECVPKAMSAEETAVRDWLAEKALEELTAAFVSNGYCDVELMKDMGLDDDDLDFLEITDLTQREILQGKQAAAKGSGSSMIGTPRLNRILGINPASLASISDRARSWRASTPDMTEACKSAIAAYDTRVAMLLENLGTIPCC